MINYNNFINFVTVCHVFYELLFLGYIVALANAACCYRSLDIVWSVYHLVTTVRTVIVIKQHKLIASFGSRKMY